MTTVIFFNDDITMIIYHFHLHHSPPGRHILVHINIIININTIIFNIINTDVNNKKQHRQQQKWRSAWISSAISIPVNNIICSYKCQLCSTVWPIEIDKFYFPCFQYMPICQYEHDFVRICEQLLHFSNKWVFLSWLCKFEW